MLELGDVPTLGIKDEAHHKDEIHWTNVREEVKIPWQHKRPPTPYDNTSITPFDCDLS